MLTLTIPQCRTIHVCMHLTQFIFRFKHSALRIATPKTNLFIFFLERKLAVRVRAHSSVVRAGDS